MTSNDSRYVGPHIPNPPRPREPAGSGPRLGPFAITPVRVTLAIALVGSLLIVLYGVVVRDATQMPVLVAGCAISGVVFGLLAVAGAYAAYQRANDGSGGRALGYAVLGGVAAVFCAALMSAAIILALVIKNIQ